MRRFFDGPLKIYVPGAVLVLIGFVLAYQFVEPAPPGTVRMATGSAGGAYDRYGKLYADILAKNGITLELIESRGSLDNFAKLNSGEVDMAFVQGGVRPEQDLVEVETLGAMFVEPFWLFSKNTALDELRELEGLRIAIGPEGSGTRALAVRWLEENGITSNNAAFLQLSGREAVSALSADQVDAVVTVASARAETVQTLLSMPDIHPMSFRRADAYVQRDGFASKVSLHEGAIDLANNIPNRTTNLVAASAALVINPDIHPAVVDLMMIVTHRIHRPGGLFERPGMFPSAHHVDFVLHENAERFFKNGPQFLLRYLPFGMANFVDRTAVMLIPLITLLLPLMRILPPALDWSIRNRVYRWYGDLRDVERSAVTASTDNERRELQNRLDELEARVSEISAPRVRSDLVYTLRLHIGLIRDQLRGRL